MDDNEKTREQLIVELVELREYVANLEASETGQRGVKDASWTNKERYRSLAYDIFDTSAVGVILLDADFRIVWVNQALERYFGFCRNEIIGKDKRHLIRECIMDIFENPGSFSEKVLATYGDNTYVENFECHVLPGEEREECWLEHWSQPIRSGLYIGGRVEHYYDISERKQVEEELKRHSHHLNELVNVRTAELSKANEQLHQEITKCKQIEVYLQQSEESARALLNAIPGSALLIDTQGIILNINEIAARAIGYSPDEIINKRSYDLLPPSVAKSRKAYTKKVARTRHAIEFEDERDGRVIYNSLNPVLNQQGQVTRIAVFSQDITDSKQMEMAFQKSKDYLNTLMDSMADAVFTVKMPARKIEFVNQAVYELLGYHSEELIDQSTRQFYPDEGSFDSFGQALKDALDQGQSQVRQEQVLLRKNGEQLWTEINTAFLFSNGQLSQVISVVRDIAERKQAEEKLQKSEEQYGRLVENAPDILYAFSDKRGGVYYSNRVRTVLGHTPSYLLEHPLVWHDSIHPDDLPLVDQAIAGLKIGKLFDIEYRIWDANKNLHWFRDRPIGQWKDGDETIVEGLASDITERKRIEEALQQRVEQLAALQATTLEITSPHDLSTLLRTIVERATSLLKAPGGGMYLCDPVQEEVRCVVSYNTFNDYTGTVLKYGEGSAGTVALTGQPLAIDDYRTWPMRAKVYEEDQPFTAVLSMPLIWQDRVSGVIHVLDSVKGRRFTQSDIELLTLFANQAAIAIHNAQLFEAEQEQRRLAEALSEISQTLTSTLHLDEVLDKVLNNVERIVPHQGTNIHLLDEKSEIVQIHQIKGYQNAHLGKPGKGTTRHVCEIPLYRQMMEARQAVVVSDTHAEPNWTLFAGTHWVRSYLGIPICRGERVFGFLNLDSATPGFFTDKHAHK
nr:PAS domain S-box protein [Deltaproteobacteria bacterium]